MARCLRGFIVCVCRWLFQAKGPRETQGNRMGISQVDGSGKQGVEVTRATRRNKVSIFEFRSNTLLPRTDKVTVTDNVPAERGRTKQP